MLDLKYTETTSLVTIDGKKISLPFIATDPLPAATIPSFIHVARNTSVVVPKEFSATRIYQTAKLRPPYETYHDGKMVLDPATIKPQTITLEPVQFAPCQVSDKVIMKAMDLLSPNMNTVLSASLSRWLYDRRVDLEVAIINALVKASKNTQDKIVKNVGDEDATDFAHGAHLITETITTPVQALRSFNSALDVLKKIGLVGAKTDYDRKNRFVTGINKTDMLCICSDEFLFQLTQTSGLVTSPQGYKDIFLDMNIKKVLGIDVLPLSNLPEGVNFIFITTGAYGAFAYNSAVQGAEVDVNDSPEWKRDKIAYLSYTYIAGIVNESFIVTSINNDFVMPQSDGVKPVISDVLKMEAQSFAELRKESPRYQVPDEDKGKKK